MVTPLDASPLRLRLPRRFARRHGGSLLAAAAQVGLALVIALGSIGLASVAALVAPAALTPEQVVATTATRAAAKVPGAPGPAGTRGAASPQATPRR